MTTNGPGRAAASRPDNTRVNKHRQYRNSRFSRPDSSHIELCSPSVSMPAQAPSRAAAPSRKPSTMRPLQRPAASRAHTATPTLTGRASPADSMIGFKNRSPKRKTHYDVLNEDAGSETNINVVVRCRGRNEREVRENSGVVVSTDGIKGTKVDLSMGPNALGNKTYSFDKVFSPAADQGIVFEEVVTPILDEVLAGYNCTIFAYGQTGTGKTYTMSGDIADVMPLPDGAGIIPRVLHYLFDKLGNGTTEEVESDVKCSFIELYNEELRDLLALDEGPKLKIYDDVNKQGRTTVLVQGMEETHIQTASRGIELLRQGSVKRQVAATRCNDLSSRSHTVFAVTVCTKRVTDAGEDYICSGKLNLVDLAGSENIQRSGAENKRAAEAGLINKSLLTLGRVINALVEKGSHIPYRESKLTRLLQDSLGGRTKTCIIATLSPAKSNLEETISTLDYAFRAKNIRNKPQVNPMVSKKNLLKDFTAEIEKLKSELIVARQRNGVYLTAETYEEITTESESRRILSEEQRDRIETLEAKWQNKVQELFALTNVFNTLKRDNEQTRLMLDGTKDLLTKTEIVLSHTREALSEEKHLLQAHENTEQKLTAVGRNLLSTLGTTTNHVDRLHYKIKRYSDLQSSNYKTWSDSQDQVSEITRDVEEKIETLRRQQESLLTSLSERMHCFVAKEVQAMQTSQNLVKEKVDFLTQSKTEIHLQSNTARESINQVLEEIVELRRDVKQKVGTGLNDLSKAAEQISAGIAKELDVFHDQTQSSFVMLGRELKTIFDHLIQRMNDQKAEAEQLRQELTRANTAFVEASQASHTHLVETIQEERQTAASERAAMIAKVTSLIHDSALAQEARVNHYLGNASKRIKTSEDEYRTACQHYEGSMDIWSTNEQALVDYAVRSKETMKAKLKAEWNYADEKTTRLVENTKTIHCEATRIVDDQMAQMDQQLVSMDDIMARTKSQTEAYHQDHMTSLDKLAHGVQASYSSIGESLNTSLENVSGHHCALQGDIEQIQSTLPELTAEGDMRTSLQCLRQDIEAAQMTEYTKTGDTPARTQYTYPTVLPATESREALLERMRSGSPNTVDNTDCRPKSPLKQTRRKRSSVEASSPQVKPLSTSAKPAVYTDEPQTASSAVSTSRPATAASVPDSTSSLRELDVNVNVVSSGGADVQDLQKMAASKLLAPPLEPYILQPAIAVDENDVVKPPPKHSARLTVAGIAEGRENVPPSSSDVTLFKTRAGAGLSASVGTGGRRLRSHGSG